MNVTPETYAEICKQLAFISALVAGFSFAFLGAMLVSGIKKPVTDWVISFSVFSIAGFLVCSLAWTLSASRMAIYSANKISELPAMFISMHRILSFTFILSFFFFIITLGLSGWIRSLKLGIISTCTAIISAGYIIVLLSKFNM